MRAFLGISVPEELKPRIVSVQEKFSAFDVKFVESENLHFNLRFFREISDEQVEHFKKSLEEIAKQYKPFEIGISGVGAFSNKTFVRVLWLGVKEGYQTLASLAEKIENAAKSLGFESEEKFVPHLTLGRVRSGRNKDEMLALLKEVESAEIGKMQIKELKFVHSKLSRNGPIYEEVFCIKL